MVKNQLVDSRDVRFVLYEMLGVDKLNEKISKYETIKSAKGKIKI